MSRALPTALSLAAGALPFWLLPAGLTLAQSTERVVVERPPTEVARGLIPTSAFVVIALGSALVVVAAVYIVRQARRR